YQNTKIVPILKEYSAKKYGRKREFVDAEINARLGVNTVDETKLPDPNAVPPSTVASSAPTPSPSPVEVVAPATPIEPTPTAPVTEVTPPAAPVIMTK
ncbi:MAG: hypothetical protein WCG98_01530, partial [bacterium]